MNARNDAIRRRRRRAFTLIELLVVIAIIAILAAILFPVFAQAKLAAKKAVALSNTKQLSLAQNMYNGDYDDLMPTAFACVQPPPGGRPHPGELGWACDGHTNEGWIPIESQLLPYTKNVDMWESPADPTNPSASWAGADLVFDPAFRSGRVRKRSYQYATRIATQEWWDKPDKPQGHLSDQDENTGMSAAQKGAISITKLDAPAETISMVEAWNDLDPFPLGFWAGDTFGGCDVWKLNGRPAGHKLPPPCGDQEAKRGGKGYNGDGNYVFTDGHAKALSFNAVAKPDFWYFKHVKPSKN